MIDETVFDDKKQVLNKLLTAYGLQNERDRIYEAMPFGIENIEVVDVLNVIARMGYTVASIRVRPCDIDDRLLPCAFVEEKSLKMRAIIKPSKDTVYGSAYFFTKEDIKDPKEQKETRNATGYGWFRSTIVRFNKLFVRIFCMSFILSIVSMALPLFMMAIYNRVSDITTYQIIISIGFGALIILILETIIRYLRSKNLAWFAARIDSIVSNRVLSRLLQLPAHAIERASVASQISRLRSFDSVREFFTGPLFLTLLDLPFTIVAFITMVIIGGDLALVPVGLVVLYFFIVLIFSQRLKLAMFHAARARSNAQMHHIELFEKIQALRLNGMNEVWQDQFRDISASGSLASFRSQYTSQVLEICTYTLTTITAICVIYIGVLRVLDGMMSGGALFASLILFWRVISPWQTLVSNLPRLEQLQRSIQQIDRLMDIDTERENALALGKINKLQGSVEFSKVGLRYNKDNDPVFVGLSFSIHSGEIATVAGGNGTGKSTLLKLALGLYKQQAGAIYIDGRDIRQIDPIMLRQKIAYIPQIPEMFDGTIADNLRLSNSFATDNDLWNALDLADAKSQIESLPQGINTPIHYNKESVRSNLIYRIMLARAYVKDANLFLIDEMPYSVLNSRAGDILIDNIKEWRGNKTVIMVSHRDDHIRIADKAIGLLDGGRSIIASPDKVIKQLREESFHERRILL